MADAVTNAKGYTNERVPCEPFMEWIEARIAWYENQDNIQHGAGQYGAETLVARELGLGNKSMTRYRHGEQEHKGPDGERVFVKAKDFSLLRVEEALRHAGVFLWEVYPDLPEFQKGESLERKWCAECFEEVFVDERGECLWCLGRREARARGLKRMAA